MNLTSLLITTGLGVLLAFTVLTLTAAIARNLKNGRRFRQRLTKQVEQLRLSRMLEVMGIDRDRYLHQRPVVAIKQHMANCEACNTKARCDQTLPEATAESDLDFCPNQGSLNKSVPG